MMNIALLDRLAHHCEIIETGNETLASKPRLSTRETPVPPRFRPRVTPALFLPPVLEELANRPVIIARESAIEQLQGYECLLHE